MISDPSPSPRRRGRPAGLLSSAHAVLRRADLKDCTFVLGPWLESLHPRKLADMIQDLQRAAEASEHIPAEPDLIGVVFAILKREVPESDGCFRDDQLCAAFDRLRAHAVGEELRREGFWTIEGERALSAENDVKFCVIEPESPVVMPPPASAARGADTLH